MFRPLFLLLLFASSATLAAPNGIQTVRLDGNDEGRIFEGIGALSAGASSRLLIDYPEPQRSHILDLLFKPRYGAALHQLKVEIGGGVNSTDGSEPSHARDRREFSDPKKSHFDRGYEWWLMKEARKRNPNIVLGCLMWGAPGWTGEDGKPYTPAGADYVVSFIKGARKHHGLKINHTGIWNERMYDIEWIKLLRHKLDAAGLPDVEIVAADQVGGHIWTIVEDMMRDPELADAVAVVGEHYPGGTSQGGSTPLAVASGKRLWSSEDSTGGGAWESARWMAARFNGNYIRGRMTATIVWSLITSYYDSLLYPGSGPMRASSPWSGHYDPQDGIWVIAHTTQFAAPGWRYLNGGCGLLRKGGTFVTLRSTDWDGDYTIVAETNGASADQEVGFRISGGLSTENVIVWRSNAEKRFVRLPDISPRSRSFTVKLEKDSIYSFTTSNGQQRAALTPPAPGPFPFPYRDGFEKIRPSRLPRFFSDQYGSFETASRPDGTGRCLRQMVTEPGVPWRPERDPMTIAGDSKWTDYEFGADCLIEKEGHVFIAGRVGPDRAYSGGPFNGVVLKVDHAGGWQLSANDRVLDSGTVEFGADKWHNLKLSFGGVRIWAWIDGVELTCVSNYQNLAGMVALGSGFNHARFDSVEVEPLSDALARKPGPRNLAHGATATASSTWTEKEFSGDWGPHRANDDDRTDTRWNAAAGTGAGEWLELDFGSSIRFDTTIVTEYGDRVSGYRIQVPTGPGWRDVAAGEALGSTPKVNTFTPVLAKKVRLLIDSTTGSCPSIHEFEVYSTTP